jgi:N-acetylmuramoyl-L-alanine amidase
MATGRLHLLPSDKLAAAMGGTVKRLADGHYQFHVGESTLEFTPDVPFAKSDSEAIPLAEAPVVIGKTLYVPFQVVSDIVPHYVTGFMYDTASGEVRAFNTAARKGTPTAPRDQVADAPSSDDGDDDTPAFTPPADEPDDNGSVATNRHRLVVVDAGHGGVDNGMHGPLGGGPQIYEKNITLTVAKLVAQDLREAGLRVLMTRTTDTLIGLYDRGKIANAHHGDVFVSIHVNATGSRGRDAIRDRGFETYFLAEAKTEDAKRVEAMENSAVRFETSVNAAKGDPLRAILTDMAQNEHLRESSELAQIVEDGLHKFHPGPDRGVQQANFAVLRGSFMPAILCEIGFGTNPSEAAYISDTDNQRTIARSIAKSVVTYLNRYERRVSSGTRK